MTKKKAVPSKAGAKKPAPQVPQAVWWAMANQGLHPGELAEWEVTEHDIHLHLKNAMYLRIEISSIQERFTSELQPCSGKVTAAQVKKQLAV